MVGHGVLTGTPMALAQTYVIPPATADVAIRQALTVFVRGSFAPHAHVLETLWRRLFFSRSGARLKFRRSISDASWEALSGADREGDFARLFDLSGPLLGCRGVEFAERSDDPLTGASLQVVDLATVNGVERASHLRFMFEDSVSGQEVVSLAEWLLDHLPVWWGSAGFVFDYVGGPSYTAYGKIAALAKRYWCVQLQEVSLLQWDALRGMPSVNWLTLIGDECARSKEMSIERVTTDAANLKAVGLFHRQGANGVALAAGPRPVYGDINVGEDIAAYKRIAQLIEPLLLTEHAPLFGPFSRPEVLDAWLRRFEAPQAWLECNIAE